ncbi:MAG: hypothetical protein JXP34_21990 [Planctomycetes bacterium]|nr:hypothetical protein [Planctomycetota bacterium]
MGIHGGLAARGSRLYVGVWDGSLYGFDLSGGGLRRLDATFHPNPACYGYQARLRDGLFGVSGLACDGRGRLYIADGDGNSLSCFDLEGPHAGRLHRPPLFYDAHFGIDETDDLVDVAVDSEGERIYVAYCDGRLLHAVQILDRSFRHVRTISSRGEEGRRFEFVRALTCTEDRLVVTDWSEREVQVFDPDGRFLQAIGARELGPGWVPMVALALAGGMVVGGLGQSRSPEILRLDAGGRILWKIDVAEADRPFTPCSLVVARDRIVALTNGGLDRDEWSAAWRVIAIASSDGRILDRVALGWGVEEAPGSP